MAAKIAVGGIPVGLDDISMHNAQQNVQTMDALLQQSDTLDVYQCLKALLVEVDPALRFVVEEKVSSEESGVADWLGG